MKFTQYVFAKSQAIKACTGSTGDLPDPSLMNPVLLAYIGDAIFTFYTRLKLLPTSTHVRVLNDLDMKLVSAVYQCQAMEILAERLTEEEKTIYHRGRNAKTTVPKSATVREYRVATAFEALLGWLYLTERYERLEEFLEDAFNIISNKLQQETRCLNHDYAG